MAPEPGSLLTLDVEKPAVGGRMLARHDGQVVLVWGAIPGERVRARIERVSKGLLHAETVDIVSPSPDRREANDDWRCGGSTYAHIAYPRQLALKAEIIRETLGRIGRFPLSTPPPVVGSPERGYRMRARLRVRGGRLGFFREGTHEICDPAITGQLLPRTLTWIRRTEDWLGERRLGGLTWIEMAENVPGSERACHLELEPGADPAVFAPIADSARVTDTLRLNDDGSVTARFERSPRAFFQGNRFLLEPLVRHVLAQLPDGPVFDLYSGVGLFGVSAAAAGAGDVVAIEGDPVSGADLVANAGPWAPRVRVERMSVESFLVLAPGRPFRDSTFVIDPPRTGISKAAMEGIVRARAARIVYVSCDIATFARDSRTLIGAGYTLDRLTGMDLFPNTAHVESVAVFNR